MSRLRLNLVDLLAAVGTASLGLAVVHWAAPGRLEPGLIVIGPLLGILVDRARGGRGITGGALGGLGYACVCLLLFFVSPPPWGIPSRATIPNWPSLLIIMTTACLVFGTLMGLVTWAGAVAMRKGRTEVEAEPITRLLSIRRPRDVHE